MNKYLKEFIMYFLVGLLICVFIILGFYISSQNGELKRTKTELEWYKTAIKTKNGWSNGYGSYRIVSFDGGETWYNYEGHADPEATRNDGFYFLTPTDTALVKHIKAWDAIYKFVDKNGPIDFTAKDLSVEEQKQLLEDVGFELKEKK
jgi:hypothetical protein